MVPGVGRGHGESFEREKERSGGHVGLVVGVGGGFSGLGSRVGWPGLSWAREGPCFCLGL